MLKRMFKGIAVVCAMALTGLAFTALGWVGGEFIEAHAQQPPKPATHEQLQAQYLDGLCDVAKGQVKALQAVNEIQRQQIEELSKELDALKKADKVQP